MILRGTPGANILVSAQPYDISTEKVVETFKPVNSGKLANEASTVNE
jgi:hypothetical protein